MALTFYPHSDDANKGTIDERIDTMMAAAERYRTSILDSKSDGLDVRQRLETPRDLEIAYNWEAIAILLREVRELPEGSKNDKSEKAKLLVKLAEVYEVLRAAKMSKLEAVRLALIAEANQLKNIGNQVA